jgi:tetratricopeptide (TPR) repeat protein
MNFNKKFFQKHGLKITEDAMATTKDRHILHTSERFHGAIQSAFTVTPKLIAEIESYVARYPDFPAFKNYLYIAYMQANQMAKATYVLHQTIAQHPNYVFGHLSMANIFVEAKNYEQAAAILKAPYDVRHFEKEAFVHVSAFISYYSTAIRIEAARDNAEEAERMHRLLFDYDPKLSVVKELGTVVLAARMKKRMEVFDNMPQKNVEATLKPVQGNYLSDSDGKPIFNHPEIHQLYKYSEENIPKKLIQQILALPRPTLIKDLEHALADAVIRFDDFKDDEWEMEEITFPIHALYFLTELKSEGSLPIILDFLRQDKEFMDFWLGDDVETHFQPTLYLLANTQLAALKNYVLEENNLTWFRLVATEVATQVALKQPERRAEVVEWFKSVIHYHLENADNDNLIDSSFLSFLMGEMINFGGVELTDDITALYTTGWVDDSCCGDLAMILKDVHEPDLDYNNHPLPTDIHELYSKEHEKRRAKSKNALDLQTLEKMKDPYDNFLIDVMTEAMLAEENEDEDIYDEDDDDYDVPAPHLTVKRTEPKIGRNDPCPCGSGKKYKKCHGG